MRVPAEASPTVGDFLLCLFPGDFGGLDSCRTSFSRAGENISPLAALVKILCVADEELVSAVIRAVATHKLHWLTSKSTLSRKRLLEHFEAEGTDNLYLSHD